MSLERTNSHSHITISREHSLTEIGTPNSNLTNQLQPPPPQPQSLPSEPNNNLLTTVTTTTVTGSSIPPPVRSTSEDESKALIEEVKALARSEELLTRIDEIFNELEQQYSKIVLAMKTSPTVKENLRTLKTSMIETEDFYQAVTAAWMFTSKSKLKLRMQNHYQTIRGRCTQLMTAVSLELLTSSSSLKPGETEPAPVIASELYHTGIYYFYGIHNKPKNFIFAFEKFIQGAELQDSQCMFMTGLCYLSGYGVEEQRDLGLQWLEKAANHGQCPAAKTEIARQILHHLKQDDPKALKKYFYVDSFPTPYTGNSKYGPGTVDSTQSVNRSISVPVWDPNPATRRQQSSAGHDTQHSEFDETGPLTITTSNLGDEKQDHDEDIILEASDIIHHDIQYAMKLLCDAASEGHIEAKTELGLIYEELEDYEQAAKWYSHASNGGCSKGTCQLGSLLFFSRANYVGTRQKAFSLFSMAAKNGQAEAFNGLGLCYEAGIGAERNVTLAIVNYRIGAKLGSSQAMYNLGYLLVKNAIEILDEKKEKQKKVRSSSPSSSPGRKTPSSVKSDPYETELFSELGIRVEDALSEGIHWLRAAAENRVADAAFQLGRLYEQQIGVPYDEQAALSNYLFASSLSHARSALFAANLLYKVTDVNHPNYSKNMVKIGKLYKQAAIAGDREAMNSYALLLEDGRANANGIRDVYAAATWFYEACRLQYIPSFLNLALLFASETIHSFPTVKGEMISLPKVVEYLEENLPVDIDEERLSSFQAFLHSAREKNAQTQKIPRNPADQTNEQQRRQIENYGDGILVSKEKPELAPPHLHQQPELSSSEIDNQRARQSIDHWRDKVQAHHHQNQDSQSQQFLSRSSSYDYHRQSRDEENEREAQSLVLAENNGQLSRSNARLNKQSSQRVSISDIAAFNPQQYYPSPSSSYVAPSSSQNYYDQMKAKLRAGGEGGSNSSPQRSVELLARSVDSNQSRQPPQQKADRKVTFPAMQSDAKQYVSISFPTNSRLNSRSYTALEEEQQNNTSSNSVLKSGELYVTNGAIPPPVYVPKAFAPEKLTGSSKPKVPAGSYAQNSPSNYLSNSQKSNPDTITSSSSMPTNEAAVDQSQQRAGSPKKGGKTRDYSPKRKETVSSGNISLDQQFVHLNPPEALSEETKRNSSITASMWSRLYRQSSKNPPPPPAPPSNEHAKGSNNLSTGSYDQDGGVDATYQPNQQESQSQQRYGGGHGPERRNIAVTNMNPATQYTQETSVLQHHYLRNNRHPRDMNDLALNKPDLI